MSTQPHKPRQIRVRARGAQLELHYADSPATVLSAELLRVCSPSAEVQGHGGGEGRLVGGKRDVTIAAVEPVGRYAVRLRFSDGHDTGLYSWDLLRQFVLDHEARWQRYQQRLAEAGMSRDAEQNVVPLNALLRSK